MQNNLNYHWINDIRTTGGSPIADAQIYMQCPCSLKIIVYKCVDEAGVRIELYEQQK